MALADMRRGPMLRAYLAASRLIPLAAPAHLRRRLKRGKEDPRRWREKLGEGLAPRPNGPLIWLHAVGLGEVLSLRGLIVALSDLRPELSFLVTSSTAASATVFAKNAPPRTLHQFLPLDAPAYRRRFLDHFRPDLCIWVEQDLWPGMVSDLAQRGIPQCIVAARMNARSLAAHQRAAGLFRDLYGAMALITAQDEKTATHLHSFGVDVAVTGSLKPAAPSLSHDPDALSDLQTRLADRFVWAVAPAHPADMAVALAAHDRLRQARPDALLIIAPRFPDQPSATAGPRRSKGEVPDREDAVWICDTFGELGLIYRLTQAVLIGGTFSDIEGHNPWEAAILSNAILHGPRTANFATDFAYLAADEAALLVNDANSLAAALQRDDLAALAARAAACTATARAETTGLAERLVTMLKP